jgi:hypothetical protein
LLADLAATTLEKMWSRELDDFEKEYGNYKKRRETGSSQKGVVKIKKAVGGK